MEITSLKFALLAITAVFIIYIIPSRLKVGYLVLLSCGLIASYNIFLPFYLAAYAFINYLVGQKLPASKHKTALFRAGIILNLSQLILLRYASFAIDPVLEMLNVNIRISILSEIIIPIGISYYTLQG